MSFIVLSGMPGQDPEATWTDYKEATGELCRRAGSDRAYEDVMNGLAYLDGDGNLVYEGGDDDFNSGFDDYFRYDGPSSLI